MAYLPYFGEGGSLSQFTVHGQYNASFMELFKIAL